MDSKPNGSTKLDELKKARSKRVQILIPPSVHDKLKSISKKTGASVNEIINKAIENFIRDL